MKTYAEELRERAIKASLDAGAAHDVMIRMSQGLPCDEYFEHFNKLVPEHPNNIRAQLRVLNERAYQLSLAANA